MVNKNESDSEQALNGSFAGFNKSKRAHANDAGADIFSPKDAVIRPGAFDSTGR